jgi:molecular chaperone DnaK (HSP70)
MPYVLGVDVGSSTASAAVCRRTEDGWSEATVVRLGARSATVGSTLRISADGTVSPRDVTGHDEPGPSHRSIRGYVRRVGDDVPFMIGNQPYPAHGLTAAMVRWVVDRVWAVEGEPAEQVALACPSGWGPYREGLLSGALRDLGLDDVVLVAAALAAVAGHGTAGELPAPGVFAGYDLGGTGFTGSVVERRAGGGMELVSVVEHPVGGSDLDDALVTHVLARAGSVRPTSLSAAMTAWLRDSCAVARERLSVAAEAVVPVPTPTGQVDVVVTRAELAELVRPVLQPTADGLARLVRDAGTQPVAVVLAGGAARTPGLADLLAARLPVPVRADPQPDAVGARGAALAARRVLTRSRAARPAASRGQA